MKRILFSLLIGAILVWTLPAYSATVVYHGNHVEEINGLVVGSALYDVTFREVEYVTNWLLDSPTFMGDEEGAGAAVHPVRSNQAGLDHAERGPDPPLTGDPASTRNGKARN